MKNLMKLDLAGMGVTPISESESHEINGGWIQFAGLAVAIIGVAVAAYDTALDAAYYYGYNEGKKSQNK